MVLGLTDISLNLHLASLTLFRSTEADNCTKTCIFFAGWSCHKIPALLHPPVWIFKILQSVTLQSCR